MSKTKKITVLPRNIQVANKSLGEKISRKRSGLPAKPNEIAPGFPPTPAHDLVYHGGRTIVNLAFFNMYLGGETSWTPSDIISIDKSISAAMSDKKLNNVMAQYYPGKKVTSVFQGSKILDGTKPEIFTKKDGEGLLRKLYLDKKLGTTNFGNTVFNFILPSRSILTDSDDPGEKQSLTSIQHRVLKRKKDIPREEEVDSLNGLGGYHGSIHVKEGSKKTTLYYSIDVYSERLPNGKSNGIPVFNKSWKNIVATLYHELNEARTDADVEDAILAGDSPKAEKFLGWVDKHGFECGDFPIEEAGGLLSKVFKEVSLSDGSGKVPIQLEYSNAVHGPEGPISAPH